LVVPRFSGFHAATLHAGSFPRRESAATAAGAQIDLRRLTPAQTFAAADIDAVMQVFCCLRTVFLVVGLIAASLFRNPPRVTTWLSPKGHVVITTVESYSPSQIHRDAAILSAVVAALRQCHWRHHHHIERGVHPHRSDFSLRRGDRTAFRLVSIFQCARSLVLGCRVGSNRLQPDFRACLPFKR